MEEGVIKIVIKLFLVNNVVLLLLTSSSLDPKRCGFVCLIGPRHQEFELTSGVVDHLDNLVSKDPG